MVCEGGSREARGRGSTIRKGWISLLCAACLAAAATGAGLAASGTSERALADSAAPYKEKSISHTDPAGDVTKDANGNHAADITDLAIFNKKDGKTYIVVTVDQLKIYSGDYVDVYIDTDRNANTGCLGDEYVLQATGVTDPNPDTFAVGKCASGDTFNFNIAQTGFAAEFNESTRQAIFLFTPKTIGGATKFNYSAYTFWVPSIDPNGDYKDKAPDNGRYSFSLDPQVIPCSTVFGHLVRDPGWRGVSSAGKLTLTSLKMRGVPAGATVLFRSGSISETVRAGASGVAQSRRLLRRALSPGTPITVRITKATCSTTVTLRVNKAGNDLVRS